MRLPRSSSSEAWSPVNARLLHARFKPPGRLRSTWLRNVADDLKEFDMDLLDARATAQNRPRWRIIAKHGATLP